MSTLFVPSGWMGEGIGQESPSKQQERARLEKSFALEADYARSPHSPPTCYRLRYLPHAPCSWVAVAWQYPEGNWGKFWGRNMSRFHRLTFWARADTYGPQMKVGFKVGGHTLQGVAHPSSCPEPVEQWTALSPEWQKYTIDLQGRDLSNLPAGFVFVVRREDYPNGGIFYLDDIRFEK